MKLNPKQSYGTITGHPWARYEQNGNLFDWNGISREENDSPEESSEEEEQPAKAIPKPLNNVDHPDFKIVSAKEFLKNILSAGPVARASIYREAEQNNQEWESVKTAFAQLGGETFKRGVSIHWKLKAE